MSRRKSMSIIILIAFVTGVLGIGSYIVYSKFIVVKNTHENNNNFINDVKDSDNIAKLNDFTFKIVKENKSKNENNFILNYNERDFYYNSSIELYLCENEDCYTLKETLQDNRIDFDNLLDKSTDSSFAYDGGSGVYYYNDFTIVVCHSLPEEWPEEITDFESIPFNENVFISNKKIDVDVCR